MVRFWFSGPRILGIRPGISLSPNDFKNKPSGRQREPIEGSFVYVISGPDTFGRAPTPNRVKIGVTKNPSQRLKTLQTGSHMRLRFAFIGCTPGEGYDIEQAAHNVLAAYRLEGEWFDVAPEMAVAAITSCAWKLGHRLQIISQEQADKALAIAAAEDRQPGEGLGMILLRILTGIFLAIIGIIAAFVITAALSIK